MSTKKDYYEVLGIPRSANDADIKNAYKKLAKEHHPDMVAKDDKEQAEKRFKEINEAYQILSDAQKRKMYDQFGHAGVGNSASSGPGAGGYGGFGQGFGGAQGQWGPFTYSYTGTGGGQGANFDPLDIFEEMFGFRGFGGQRKPKKGKNLYYEMHVDFGDAVRGAEKEIAVESGKVKIKIPAGVRHGTEMRFPEKGMSAPKNMPNVPNGDLFITFKVPTPKDFAQRAGDDLGTLVDIDFTQATLGDTITIPVVDEKKPDGVGSAKLKIPAGTQPDTQFRVRGKGMPRLRGRGNGDVIVQVRVTIPERISKKQRQILEDYRNTLP